MPLIRNTSDNPASSGPDPAAALTSVSPDERWAAARAAADIPTSIPALAQALAQESEPRVREAIFTALARIATLESALAVLPYLRSTDANIRIGALDALRAMPEAAKPLLPQVLADADADVRLLACDLVRNMHDADTPRWLCALLETELEANVCAAAVEVLERDRRRAGAADPLAMCCSFSRRSFPRICHQGCRRSFALSLAGVQWLSPVRSPTGNFAGSAIIFTGGPAWSSPRRGVTSWSAASPTEWRRLVLTSFATLFRPAKRRSGRRDREVHQCLHRQRNLFLPRRLSARLPDIRSPRRTASGEAIWRSAPHLVRPLLDGRGAIFHCNLALGKLAAGGRA